MQLTFFGTFVQNPTYKTLVDIKGLLVVGPNFIKQATFVCHDIEHVIHKLGFSEEEEAIIMINDDYIALRYDDYDLSEWFALFPHSEVRHSFCKRFDLIGQSVLITAEVINKKALVDVTIC